jgi:hypothetical protein
VPDEGCPFVSESQGCAAPKGVADAAGIGAAGGAAAGPSSRGAQG